MCKFVRAPPDLNLSACTKVVGRILHEAAPTQSVLPEYTECHAQKTIPSNKSSTWREASGTSRPGSGLLPPNPTLPPMPNFLTPPPPPLWEPPQSLGGAANRCRGGSRLSVAPTGGVPRPPPPTRSALTITCSFRLDSHQMVFRNRFFIIVACKKPSQHHKKPTH